MVAAAGATIRLNEIKREIGLLERNSQQAKQAIDRFDRMGVAHGVAMTLEGPPVGGGHDLEDLGGQPLLVLVENLHVRGIANVGLSQERSFTLRFRCPGTISG